MATCFPQFCSSPAAELGSLYRLLETPPFFPASFSSRLHPSSRFNNNQHFLAPRFDVREVPAAFELQGELPGIKQEDLDIEFVDANTLVIRGKTESHSTKTSEDGKVAKENGKEHSAESPATLAADNDATSEKSASSYHRATVEDEEYVDAGAESEHGHGKATTAASNTVSQKPTETVKENEKSQTRYWVSERATGEFERRFKFPNEVDQDAVKASLKDGILSIVVPKVARKERRILVE
ncbi:hypothetical protein MMC07_001610 [Pseudocyphellaria aurata]|nr:hypothetical protein [Pseudocyphellaria aurata]